MQNAIMKIDKEIAENNGNSYILKIGEYLKQLLRLNPLVAEQINAEGKTIKGCFEDMKSKARAKASGSCYAPSDEEVIEWINGYFGITIKVCLKTVVALAEDTDQGTGQVSTKSIFDLI